EPKLVTRIAPHRLHFPSATRKPTNGMTASLGIGAIMLSSAMSAPAPEYPAVSRQRIAQSEISSVIIQLCSARLPSCGAFGIQYSVFGIQYPVLSVRPVN